jgi:hypothetical protein
MDPFNDPASLVENTATNRNDLEAPEVAATAAELSDPTAAEGGNSKLLQGTYVYGIPYGTTHRNYTTAQRHSDCTTTAAAAQHNSCSSTAQKHSTAAQHTCIVGAVAGEANECSSLLVGDVPPPDPSPLSRLSSMVSEATVWDHLFAALHATGEEALQVTATQSFTVLLLDFDVLYFYGVVRCRVIWCP